MAKTKFKLQKKHLAFFTVVPLLAATALIQVPCPVCGGSGNVSSTGMDTVQVTNLTSHEIARFSAGCDTYRVYEYDITLTLENSGDHDAGGYINLVLVDYFTGKILDTQFTVVEVPAQTSVEHTSTTYFQMSVSIDMPDRTEIKADVLTSDVECKACDGTGKVAMNSWALSRTMRDTFIASQRVETPYTPPLWIETEGQAGVDY
jgi:hypothetical protein